MKRYVWLSTSLATVGLAIGYGLDSRWLGVAAVVALGLLWLVGQWRGWRVVTGLTVAGFFGATAYGVGQGAPMGWMLFGLVATLVGWDLDHFRERLQQAGQVEGEVELQRAHVQRLAAVVVLGGLAGAVALSFQVRLNLGWLILLGALAIVGLSRVIGRLRRESD